MQWSGVILVNGSGEILLNLRSQDASRWPGQWDIVGGTVEDGESPEECIMREVLEETGETLSALQPFKTYDVPMQDGSSSLLHVYSGRLDKAADTLLVGEGQEHRFFSLTEIEQLDVVSGIELLLREFADSPGYQAWLP